jgi:hypothetical protein
MKLRKCRSLQNSRPLRVHRKDILDELPFPLAMSELQLQEEVDIFHKWKFRKSRRFRRRIKARPSIRLKSYSEYYIKN